MRPLISAIAIAAWFVASAAAAPNGRIELSRDGWFRTHEGNVFVPLGGFHANVLPASRLALTPEERARVEANLWSGQKTDGDGHVDLWDASDEMMHRWFKQLAADGVNALRLFARARVGNDVLDLCGKLNPELQQVFHRAFAAARPYGIRFLLQIMPEPGAMCYTNPRTAKQRALPRYTREELDRLTPSQKRFLVEGKRVPLAELFTDPDVLACQKQYLSEALDWVAKEPQVFALEIYNEQGWTRAPLNGKPDYTFTYPYEDAEIRWTGELVKIIKKRLPNMLVTLSHPGFGITGYEPFKWSRGAGVDFYSPHLYAGLGGDSPAHDFAEVTGASALVMAAGYPNFYGEWGVFASPVPLEMKRYAHRDAIWLSLLSGQSGFMQWTYEFPDEYRWPAKVIAALPRKFSPEPARLRINISRAYTDFHNNPRYSRFLPNSLFPAFPFNAEKQQDPNLAEILNAYQHSLNTGIPAAFTMHAGGAISPAEFLAMKGESVARAIAADGGYQVRYIKDANNPVWLAYLRSRRTLAYGKHHVGVPEPAPLTLRFHLPKGQYRARIIDLTANSDRTEKIDGNATLRLSERTDHDYVVLVSR